MMIGCYHGSWFGGHACRYKEDLHKLALMLAETIQRDSRGLVVDVCKYQLGGAGPWPEEEPLGSLDLSTSCSEEVRFLSCSHTRRMSETLHRPPSA